MALDPVETRRGERNRTAGCSFTLAYRVVLLMRRSVPVVVGLLIAAAVLPFLPTTPAGAVAPAPVLSTPAEGAVVGANPTFEWQEANTAVRYVVQVSASPSMSPLVSGGSITTTNLRATYTQDLPAGELYWRVGAYDTPSGGTPTYSPIRKFTKNTISAPNLISPAPGFVFTFPTDPPTFTWSAVPGAKSYEIVIDNDSSFTPPFIVNKTTANTSYTLLEPQPVGQSFWWRVRAKSSTNVAGDFATERSYSFAWPVTPTPISPGVAASSIPPNTLPKIEQVDFSWTAITGAAGYDVQWDNNGQFSAPTTVRVTGTKYSPPTTINNGSYFWRVRGVTETNGVGDWGDVFTFERAWPASQESPAQLGAISLVAPLDNSLQLREPNFTWTPQRLGSRYQIQISTDVNFSSFSTATTTATSYTPYPNTWHPYPGITYYWRVRALDDPLPVNGRYTDQFSAPWKFIYLPHPVTQVAPANGSTSIAPRLEWSQASSPLIGEYRVKIYDAKGNLARQANTFNNYYFPQGLSTKAEDNPHVWKVITRSHNGDYGPEPDGGRTFTVVAPTPAQLSPTPNPTSPPNAQSIHVPPLTWNPVTTDGKYTVNYRTVGSGVYFEMENNLTVPGYAHPADNISPGEYEWFVRAYDKNGNFISEGAVGTFTIVELPASVPVSPANCPPNAACTKLYSTPTLDWEPVIGASHYRVTVALDVNFTNVFAQYDTQFSQLTPRDSYPDNQAGQAYYWYARPCWGDVCGKQPANFAGDPSSPVRAFQKIAKPVPQQSPAPSAVVSTNQITFSWGGFLQTNQSGTPADRVTQEARSYIVEVSDRADFATKVDTSPRVDQTTYTAFNKTYPEGQLYWRVIIVDGSQNLLTAPAPTTFTKASPLVTMNLPAANATVASTPTLSVTPKPFEVGWEFEVYKNPDAPITNANRVFLAKVTVPATTPTITLPAGEYGWRVRRFDADDRAGKWTAELNTQLRRFTVAGQAPNLLNPADGSSQQGNRISYEWSQVNQAVQYRVDVSQNSGFTGANVETVTTVMNAWAPRTTYADGLYYWRVSTLDADGNAVGTSAVREFRVGAQGSKYVSISPTRVLDSRGPTGGWPGSLGANRSRALKVAGGSLPAPISATAVVLNVTAVEPTTQTFLTLYPTGSNRPQAASNLNVVAGQIIPNLVTVKVGTNGQVDIYNAAGNVNVIADMVGYYDKTSGDRFTPITPSRLLDSRKTPQWASGQAGAIGAGQTKEIQVAGTGGVPSSAKAAVVNITAIEGSAQSYLMAYPTGSPKPAQASNVNFVKGQIIPNLALVKIGTGGRISLYNNLGTVNVVVDVVGYFDTDSGSYFHPLEPSRILDTRKDVGLSNPFGKNQSRVLQVTGNGGVPAGASAVVMNTTAVEGTEGSYLTVYPDGVDRPNSSNVNFSPGQIIPNLVTVGLSGNGRLRIYNNLGKVDVLGDVVGFYAAA